MDADARLAAGQWLDVHAADRRRSQSGGRARHLQSALAVPGDLTHRVIVRRLTARTPRRVGSRRASGARGSCRAQQGPVAVEMYNGQFVTGHSRVGPAATCGRGPRPASPARRAVHRAAALAARPNRASHHDARTGFRRRGRRRARQRHRVRRARPSVRPHRVGRVGGNAAASGCRTDGARASPGDARPIARAGRGSRIISPCRTAARPCCRWWRTIAR